VSFRFNDHGPPEHELVSALFQRIWPIDPLIGGLLCIIGGYVLWRWLKQQRRGSLENMRLAMLARGWRTWPDRTGPPNRRSQT
jgi:hypothetical protein